MALCESGLDFIGGSPYELHQFNIMIVLLQLIIILGITLL